MVEKTKKIVHKNYSPGYSTETLCGLWLDDDAGVRVQKSWRWVTCKRCLRSKPKK